MMKISQSLPTYLEYSLHVDRINSSLSRTESYIIELHLAMPLHGNGRDGHITQEIILRNHSHNIRQLITSHQTEWGIGIRHPLMEHQPYHKAQSLGYKHTATTILTPLSVANLKVIVMAMIPHLPKLLWIGLPIRVCLKYIICLIFQSMSIQEQHRSSMPRVFFGERLKEFIPDLSF